MPNKDDEDVDIWKLARKATGDEAFLYDLPERDAWQRLTTIDRDVSRFTMSFMIAS